MGEGPGDVPGIESGGTPRGRVVHPQLQLLAGLEAEQPGVDPVVQRPAGAILAERLEQPPVARDPGVRPLRGEIFEPGGGRGVALGQGLTGIERAPRLEVVRGQVRHGRGSRRYGGRFGIGRRAGGHRQSDGQHQK